MEEHLTKKERKGQRKLEELAKMEHGEKSKNTAKTKGIIIIGAAVLFLAFFGFSIYASKTAHEKKTSAAPLTFAPTGWVTGNPTSRVAVTEFGDLQCPACRVFEPTMQQVRKDYGGKVKIVFKHFPLTNAHPNAMAAAIAAEAAGVQGKFWEFHDTLYSHQDEWAPLLDPTPKFLGYAKALKLDIDKFKLDLKNKDFTKKINTQEDEGIKVGVNATPTIYVNGKYLGVPDYSTLKAAIDAALTSKK